MDPTTSSNRQSAQRNGVQQTSARPAAFSPPRPRALDDDHHYEVEGPRKPPARSPMAGFVCCTRGWAVLFAAPSPCVTVSYVKSSTITIRLDDELGRELDRACARTGRTRSDLARDALRRQLALLRFERLRKRTLPFAESQGYLTDEDVFRDVS